MLQACMKNKREYKVVVIQGIPQYVSKIEKRSSGESFSAYPHTTLFNFATAAIQRTKQNGCPGLITSGLMRVDIFKTMSGKLVVNELESLDAEYAPTSSKEQAFEHEITEFLCQYWNSQLSNCFIDRKKAKV